MMAQAEQAKVSFEVNGHTVAVIGGLNRDTVPVAWQQRQQWAAGTGTLTLDLTQVQAVDSAGLAMLIQLQAELQQQGRALHLHSVNKQLRAIAEVSGVSALLSLS